MLRLVLLIPLLGLFLSCHTPEDPQGLAEANRQADKIWATYFTKCGDSYVGRKGDSVYQIKNMMPTVVAQKLTEADKLNGIEWKGTMTGVAFGPYRINQNGVWGPWKDNDSLSLQFAKEDLQKVRGEWKVDSHLGFSAVLCPE